MALASSTGEWGGNTGTAVGLGLEFNFLPNNYMLSAGCITHLSLCQKESVPCISQSPLPVFSIIICNRDCVGSGEAGLLWGVCVCVCVCVCVSVQDSKPERKLQADKERLL